MSKFTAGNTKENVWDRIIKGGEDECWEWQGYLVNGYGRMKIHQQHCPVHRLVYELTSGAIPVGLYVLHHCDNRKCCNPKHLFLGTYKDNSNDKVSKGRQWRPIGEKHPQHILTWNQVSEIRKLYSTGDYTQLELATQFKVCRVNISQIILNKVWRI